MQRLVICGLCLLGFAYPAVLPSDAAVVTNGDFQNSTDFADWNIAIPIPSGGGSGAAINQVISFNGSRQALLATGTEAEGSTAGVDTTDIESALGLSTAPLASATQGSWISQSITLQQNESIQFDWNFYTNEENAGSNNDDFAFWSLSPAGGTEGSVNDLAEADDATTASDLDLDDYLTSSDPDFIEMTGATTFTSTALNAGDYVLGFGVVDVGNDLVNSALMIDNVQINAAPPTAVPEPGSLALLGLGTVGLAWRRRRRKQAKDVASPTAEA